MSKPRQYTASQVCYSYDKFNSWAKSVHLDQNIHEDLPKVLQELLAASRTLPGWAAEKSSDIYEPFKPLFGPMVSNLARNAAERPPMAPDDLTDNALNTNLANALFPILSISKHFCYIAPKLGLVTGEPSEADLRTPLDQLANLVWSFEGVPGLSHLLDRKLQLPGAGSIPDMLAASTAHFSVPSLEGFSQLLPAAQRPFSTLIDARVDKLQVLHWATDYKPDGAQHEEAAERQVMMAMVSGLYQRRALGFLEHFVFGAAHSGNLLRVLAGAWTLKRSHYTPTQAVVDWVHEQETTNYSAKALECGHDMLNDVSGPSTGGNVAKGCRVANEGTAAGVDQVQTIEDAYIISVFELGEYGLRQPLDIAELYLLMRASRSLALTYAAEIGSAKRGSSSCFFLSRPPFDWTTLPRTEPSGMMEDVNMEFVASDSSSATSDPVREK
ncbi:hypothetical protein BDV93DRAFT_561976 [Ceratobasidium sp. AG-I]|nr:hypothetical protein BDV93DRAFT_561976 [Ceratobasidium sp. AG-I]